MVGDVSATEGMAAAVPRTKSFEATIGGVRTHFVLTAYTNRIFVIVTQTQNMGTLVRGLANGLQSHGIIFILTKRVAVCAAAQIMACADDPLNPNGTSFSTRVIVGRRDDEALEAYARTMVELICKRSPDAGPLLLSISIQEHSNEVFHAIMRQIEENRVW